MSEPVRELHRIIDRRVAQWMADYGTAFVRGLVTEVDTGGFRLSARLDLADISTPGIAFPTHLSPVVGDDVLVIRRADGLRIAVAVLGREPLTDNLLELLSADTTEPPRLRFRRHRLTGQPVQDGDSLGAVDWYGMTDQEVLGGRLSMRVDGTPGAGVDLPTTMFFATHPAGAGTALTDRMALRSAGALDLLSGQLKFPATQNASSDATTFDDYEEGDWTPVFTSSNGGSATMVGSSTTWGKYTKMGRHVLVNGSASGRRGSLNAGTLLISGLPFTYPKWSAAAIGYYNNFGIVVNAYEVPVLYVQAGANYFVMAAIYLNTTQTTVWATTTTLPTDYDAHIIFSLIGYV